MKSKTAFKEKLGTYYSVVQVFLLGTRCIYISAGGDIGSSCREMQCHQVVTQKFHVVIRNPRFQPGGFVLKLAVSLFCILYESSFCCILETHTFSW